jgi:outer membrane protein assembly factor BamD (BamD/ComL family)
MNIRLLIPALVCVGAALTACNTAESDWNKATAANTVPAYQAFLQRYPGDQHADNAQGRILALKDEQAWRAARATNSIAAYQGYLTAEGGGVHVGEANYQITSLRRVNAWKAIPNDASAEVLQAFLTTYPQGIESNEARARLAELDYRVQLADSRNKAQAERKRSQLATKFGQVLHQVVVLAPNAPDTLFRVTSGPMSQASANSACATLEHEHQHCKVVQG